MTRRPRPSSRRSAAASTPDRSLSAQRAGELARLREVLRADLLAPAEEPDPFSDRASTVPDLEPATEEQLPNGDDYPEFTRYRDEGCHLAPACLSCPLPACIYEQRGSRRERSAEIAADRNRTLRRLASMGWSTARLVQRFGLSPAQVRRITKP